MVTSSPKRTCATLKRRIKDARLRLSSDAVGLAGQVPRQRGIGQGGLELAAGCGAGAGGAALGPAAVVGTRFAAVGAGRRGGGFFFTAGAGAGARSSST